MANEVEVLTTKQVAPLVGIATPMKLRRILRAMPQYADGKHTNYRWNGPKDPMIAEIRKFIAARKAQEAEAAKAALAKTAAPVTPNAPAKA
jgi:hypothetical protein